MDDDIAMYDSNFILEFYRKTLKNMVMESPKSIQNGTLQISDKVSNLLLQSCKDSSIKQKSIVSSYNIGSVLRLNHHFSREQELYAKIHSIKKEKDDAMQHGIDMEASVAQMFADAYGVVLYKSPLVISKESPYVCALSDRLTHDGFNVEIKVPMWRAVTTDFDLEDLMIKMPEYYHQMQLQMHVLNLDNTWFVQYGGPPNKYHTKSTTKNTDAFHKKLNNNSVPHLECEVLSAIIVPREVDWWNKHEKEILSFVDEVLDGKNKIKQQ